MADSAVEKTETVAPVEKEVEKPASTEEAPAEDTKQAENGKKENGKPAIEEDEEESKEAENGAESTEAEEACPVKRKSAGGDAPDGTPVEGASPEKKAKLDTADNGAEDNGVEAKAAA